MLSQQTRRSISLRQAAVLRPIGLAPRSLPQQTAIANLGQRCVVTQSFQPRRRRAPDATRITHGRTLATAVDEFKFGISPFADVQNQLAGSGLHPFPGSTSYYDMHSHDRSSPLTLPEPPEPRPFAKVNIHGIPGEIDEMLPVFDACIRVGRLERASLILKRMNQINLMPGDERIVLHNQYLRASLDQMRMSPNRTQAEALHKWYELQIRNQDMPQTAETIACMLKASLLSERGARLERLVKRYMSMAPGEAGLRVLSMADILSDQDLGVITEICPTYSFAAESDDADYVTLVPEEEEFEEGLEAAEADYPDVRPTPQRGEGLSSLKRGLSLMLELQNVDISKLPVEEQREFQMRLERDSIDVAIEKWRNTKKNMQKMGVNTTLNMKSSEDNFAETFHSWLETTEARLKEEIALVEFSETNEPKSEEDLERCIFGPILRAADPTRLAAVTILSVLNNGAMLGLDKGMVMVRLVNDVARAVQDDLQAQLAEKAVKERRRLRKVKFTASPDNAETDAETDTSSIIIDAKGPALEKDSSQLEKIMTWTASVRARVGSILLKSLVETAKINVVREHPLTKEIISQLQPAFSHMQAPRKGKKVGILTMNADLVERMKREPAGDFLAKHLPMIAEPQPWRRLNEGGFLQSKSSLVRVKPGDVEQRLYTKAAIKRGDMELVFKGLDVLGKTPWKINGELLDVMVEAWNSGLEIANMPPLEPKLETPPEPTTSDPFEKRTWVRAVKAVENERSALHSQRCYMNLQLEIARAFRKQVIYFPHNVDYRGRAYPIPTYLNHMGADHTRSILKFAKGKELGAAGLRWLKIHMANVYGFDKASFDEREAFSTNNLANIVESATNPLKGSRWWLKAEDPWQCLAACFELKAAHDLPDPTKFISHLPVHQDGTCNGLQHYAALGGDTWGAQQVNLVPGERPADVYSAVANLVKESIAVEAKQHNRFAEICLGKITRKVVKQTVMTNVYGVTFSGAKKQVCKQLDALYPDLHKETGIPNMLLATYIAKHIFSALATMFRGAHDIQYWLGEIGGRVCRAVTPAQLDQLADEYQIGKKRPRRRDVTSKPKTAWEELKSLFRSTVVWTTPLRMPVAQPYRKSTTREIRTSLQAISYPVIDQTDPVNRRKQLQGFPPNFIHSLDASHMLLSALKCDELGLNFAAVHDSFWTHAADVDVLNGVLRDAFIRIHEEDVVGRLAAEFRARYQGSLYLATIDMNSPVAKKIKELRRTSKLTPKDELLLEHKRNTLRVSGNPWDLEAAQKIITPASIYEEMAATEQDIEIEKEKEEIAGLGQILENEASTNESIREAVQEMEEKNQVVSTEAVDEMLEALNASVFEQEVIKPKKAKESATPSQGLPIWLPLTFPSLPQKGDFDVTRLRESKYFFS
ncbi:DNA-directed RNA polymerase mitochondrial [Fusarium albosuccineum]|uniref:DNA-directed RNA polymerase n=1 Tax=Fusarium albosuccineum TaxID=1237068 RepID=A0A8H4LJ65_9HYPO|nr:DNA-directed RNA polymerase mitochondrial [Fusarium albosuccineum]